MRTLEIESLEVDACFFYHACTSTPLNSFDSAVFSTLFEMLCHAGCSSEPPFILVVMEDNIYLSMPSCLNSSEG